MIERGFGSIIFLRDGEYYMYGKLKEYITKMSSNYRRLLSLVELLEESATTRLLEGSKIFILTDNNTVEYALYKGNLSSENLFNFVLMIHTLQMRKINSTFNSHIMY